MLLAYQTGSLEHRNYLPGTITSRHLVTPSAIRSEYRMLAENRAPKGDGAGLTTEIRT